MTKASLHPDFNPKKIPKLTLLPWNIRLYRLMFNLTPKVARPEGVESVVKYVNNQEFHIHRPINQTSGAALLWLHGGGLIIGKPSQEDYKYFKFVEALGITVIAPKYRLAPQHPFPTPLDDCLAAWKAVQNNPAEFFGIDPAQVAIGGTSAGGGLAASLAQRIRDDGGVQPVAQILVYPMLDDRTTTRSDVDLKEHMVWNQRSNITGWSSYLGNQRGAETLPTYAAPARTEDLSGLPPAWIGVGTLDLFYEEDVAYAKKLEAAGVQTMLNVVDGGYHGFQDLEPKAKVSKDFYESSFTFLKEQLIKPS